METKQIHITDYNYPLPDERIAKLPLKERDHSKLLVYRHGEVGEDVCSTTFPTICLQVPLWFLITQRSFRHACISVRRQVLL